MRRLFVGIACALALLLSPLAHAAGGAGHGHDTAGLADQMPAADAGPCGSACPPGGGADGCCVGAVTHCATGLERDAAVSQMSPESVHHAHSPGVDTRLVGTEHDAELRPPRA